MTGRKWQTTGVFPKRMKFREVSQAEFRSIIPDMNDSDTVLLDQHAFPKVWVRTDRRTKKVIGYTEERSYHVPLKYFLRVS